VKEYTSSTWVSNE